MSHIVNEVQHRAIGVKPTEDRRYYVGRGRRQDGKLVAHRKQDNGGVVLILEREGYDVSATRMDKPGTEDEV